jgi:hypothetical protein
MVGRWAARLRLLRRMMKAATRPSMKAPTTPPMIAPTAAEDIAGPGLTGGSDCIGVAVTGTITTLQISVS